MKYTFLAAALICSFYSTASFAGDIIETIPESPDTSEEYVFYLHGSVEEEEGSTEKYETAVEAIADYIDFVITEVRDDTDPNTYAEKLKTQVNQLISRGVPAKKITISGFSKGAIISLAAAGVIQNPEVNYVLLAGCSVFLNNKYDVDPSKAVGRILSIYDTDDEKFDSCSGIIKVSGESKFEEVELDSGKGHKLFRIPKEKFIEQWRDPLVDWAKG